MSDEQPAGGALIPVRQEIVEFYGDQLTGVLVPGPEGAAVWCVPLRPICDYLGLSWSGQRERTMRDEVLASVMRFVRVTRTNSAGGNPNVLCLPLEYLPGWLFGINAARVKDPELAEKIARYRRECFRVLCRAFAPDLLPPEEAPSITPDLTLATQAVEQARAQLQLAEQQLAFEQELARVRNKQEVMAGYIRGFVLRTHARLDALELRTGIAAAITEAQAAEIMLAVKAVGSLLPTQSGQNGYQQVYSEMYRRYGISAYRNLPAARYQEALDWLRGWYTEIGGEAPPEQGRLL